MDDEQRCDAQHSTCCLAQKENYIMILLLRQRSILELLVSRWVGGGGEKRDRLASKVCLVSRLFLMAGSWGDYTSIVIPPFAAPQS